MTSATERQCERELRRLVAHVDRLAAEGWTWCDRCGLEMSPAVLKRAPRMPICLVCRHELSSKRARSRIGGPKMRSTLRTDVQKAS